MEPESLFSIGASAASTRPSKTAANRFDNYFTVVDGRNGQTDADRDVDRLQRWLDTHGLKSIQVQERGHRWVQQIRDKDVGKYTSKVVDFVEGAASWSKTVSALRVTSAAGWSRPVSM